MTQREAEIVPGGPRRLNTRSVAEAVASQLRSRILDGDLTDGSELPTEAVLLEEFPVSRPSLREAFRILETEGLLTVRRGKRGGTVITHPTPDTAAYHVGLLLHSRGTSSRGSGRGAEPARAAVRRAGRPCAATTSPWAASSLRSPRWIPPRSTTGSRSPTAAVDFHQQLVMAAGNNTLETLAGILESIWNAQELNWARAAVHEGDYPAVSLRREVLKAHQRISQAIEAGDGDEAVRLTRGHLKAASPYVASHGGQVRILDDYGGRRQIRSV